MKKGMGWPIGMGVILAATVLGNIGVIVFTKDDPSFAVEPDYYRRAVEWDSSQATQARSDALAWDVTTRMAVQPDGSTQLLLALTDESGAVVSGASVRGALLHVARASDVHTVAFAATPDGHYAATVPMARAGVWELKLTAIRQSATGEAEQFLRTVRLDTEQSIDPPLDPAFDPPLGP